MHGQSVRESNQRMPDCGLNGIAPGFNGTIILPSAGPFAPTGNPNPLPPELDGRAGASAV